MKDKKLSLISHFVKTHDYERFLCGLFAPVEKRDALYSLYAFYYEIAKTRDTVTDTTLGLIRLTWWREAIDEIYTETTLRDHEVIKPLAETIQKYNLSKHHFETLIYGREFDLEDKLPGTLGGLRKYADFTNYPLQALSAQILSPEKPLKEDQLKHCAHVIVLTGILRNSLHYFQNRRCLLPQDLLEDSGLDPETLYAGRGHDALKAVVCDIVWAVEESFKQIEFDKDLLPIMMHTRLSMQYIKVLKKNDFNIYIDAFHRVPPFSTLRLMFGNLIKRL